MVYINAINACIHTNTNTHTKADRAIDGGSGLSDNHQRDRVTREELRAVMTAARRRQDTKGSLVMGVNHEVLIRSKLKRA